MKTLKFSDLGISSAWTPHQCPNTGWYWFSQTGCLVLVTDTASYAAWGAAWGHCGFEEYNGHTNRDSKLSWERTIPALYAAGNLEDVKLKPLPQELLDKITKE